jgi:dUTP pyrophosphatase
MMKIKKLYEDAILPSYAHEGDAGLDLYSYETKTLYYGERYLYPAGVAVEIPQGYFGLVRPRSGLALKHGIILCSSGVIDSGYRGPMYAALVNIENRSYTISKGDRMAQLLIIPVATVNLEVVDELNDSARGNGGHGSTGL